MNRSDWVDAGYPPNDQRLTLTFAVVPNNLDIALDMLTNVSTPGHPHRGRFLSREQLHALVSHPERTTSPPASPLVLSLD